ncbi:MAG: transglutaminase domain-containing protein [Candidatus Nitrosopolaris sp.]
MFSHHTGLDSNLDQIANRNALLLYNKISEQYYDCEILERVKSLVPRHILQLNEQEDDMTKSLLGWFKNDFMSWTPKDPICKQCMNEGRGNIPLQVQIMIGTSWKSRSMEIHRCNKCDYEYTFPRYGDILKIAETRTGRCTEWSMLFGAIMNALCIETRIVHDFLDHCWNETIIHGEWVHIDSAIAYPISFNHPHYYEENWGKEYQYVLAFSRDGGVEDVTQRYTKDLNAVTKRTTKNKERCIFFHD